MRTITITFNGHVKTTLIPLPPIIKLQDNWDNTEVLSMIIKSLLPVIIGDHDAEVAFWREVWNSYSAEAIHYPMSAMTARNDVDARQIKVPTLMINGTEDQGIPISADQALSEAITNAQICSGRRDTSCGEFNPS